MVLAAGVLALGCAANKAVRKDRPSSVQAQAVPAMPRPNPTETPTIYPVKSGDTLWALSQEHMGSPFLWPLLWKANRDYVLDPDWIEIGQDLEVPEGWSGDDLDWAVALSAARPSTPGPRTFQVVK